MPSQSPLIEADDMLRQRFGNADVFHPILTIELEAKIIVRSNCGPKLQWRIVERLIEPPPPRHPG
jgi:hypothetical protein